jgi:hypothetical protein
MTMSGHSDDAAIRAGREAALAELKRRRAGGSYGAMVPDSLVAACAEISAEAAPAADLLAKVAAHAKSWCDAGMLGEIDADGIAAVHALLSKHEAQHVAQDCDSQSLWLEMKMAAEDGVRMSALLSYLTLRVDRIEAALRNSKAKP